MEAGGKKDDLSRPSLATQWGQGQPEMYIRQCLKQIVLGKDKDWQTHSQTNPHQKREKKHTNKIRLGKGDDTINPSWDPDNDFGTSWNVNFRKWENA